MEVYLDGKPLEGGVAGSTLQEMLQTIMDSSLGQERTLSEVRINGQPFEEARLGSATALPRGRAAEAAGSAAGTSPGCSTGKASSLISCRPHCLQKRALADSFVPQLRQ